MASLSLGIRPDQQPERLDQCSRCALWEAATQAVPGSHRAPLMVVGEQPGEQQQWQAQDLASETRASETEATFESRRWSHQVMETSDAMAIEAEISRKATRKRLPIR